MNAESTALPKLRLRNPQRETTFKESHRASWRKQNARKRREHRQAGDAEMEPEGTRDTPSARREKARLRRKKAEERQVTQKRRFDSRGGMVRLRKLGVFGPDMVESGYAK